MNEEELAISQLRDLIEFEAIERIDLYVVAAIVQTKEGHPPTKSLQACAIARCGLGQTAISTASLQTLLDEGVLHKARLRLQMHGVDSSLWTSIPHLLF